MKSKRPALSSLWSHSNPYLYLFHGVTAVCFPDEAPEMRQNTTTKLFGLRGNHELAKWFQSYGIQLPEALLSSEQSVFSKINIDLIMAMLPRSWGCSKATIG
jgi:hypothetical protein